MRHGDLLVAQTPSREIWFAGGHSPRRTSARKTVSRNPPWFLQPGWQTAPQCEAQSLSMSSTCSKHSEVMERRLRCQRKCVYDTDFRGSESWLELGPSTSPSANE